MKKSAKSKLEFMRSWGRNGFGVSKEYLPVGRTLSAGKKKKNVAVIQQFIKNSIYVFPFDSDVVERRIYNILFKVLMDIDDEMGYSQNLAEFFVKIGVENIKVMCDLNQHNYISQSWNQLPTLLGMVQGGGCLGVHIDDYNSTMFEDNMNDVEFLRKLVDSHLFWRFVNPDSSLLVKRCDVHLDDLRIVHPLNNGLGEGVRLDVQNNLVIFDFDFGATFIKLFLSKILLFDSFEEQRNFECDFSKIIEFMTQKEDKTEQIFRWAEELYENITKFMMDCFVRSEVKPIKFSKNELIKGDVVLLKEGLSRLVVEVNKSNKVLYDNCMDEVELCKKKYFSKLTELHQLSSIYSQTRELEIHINEIEDKVMSSVNSLKFVAGSFVGKDGKLGVILKDVFIDSHFMGDFLLIYDTSSITRPENMLSEGLQIYNLNFETGYCYYQERDISPDVVVIQGGGRFYCHPHIKNNIMCFGGYDADYFNEMIKLDIYKLTLLIYDSLSEWDYDGAFGACKSAYYNYLSENGGRRRNLRKFTQAMVDQVEDAYAKGIFTKDIYFLSEGVEFFKKLYGLSKFKRKV